MSDLAGSLDGNVGPGAVTVSGGCGQSHGIEVDHQGHPYIECEACAPTLTGGHWGWAATPAGVPPTPDENAERELAERQGTAATNIMLRSVSDALAQAAAAQLGAGRGAGPGSLLDQLKALTPAERDQLLGELTVPAVAAAVKTAAPARKVTGGKGSSGGGVQG
jgi:hypothetical protein